jgi:neutral ceramidase
MRQIGLTGLLLAATLATGCDDSGVDTPPSGDLDAGTGGAGGGATGGAGGDTPPTPDAASADEDAGRPPPDADLSDATPVDAAPPDLGPPDPTYIPDDPAAFRVGTARVRAPVPVGIGTSGFGPTAAPRNKTPYAQFYPGTDTLHTQPDIRAIVFEAGDGNRVILVRFDLIGVNAQMRNELLAGLERTQGVDYDHRLIVMATHTHAGPGRLLDKPQWHLIQDYFWAEFYVAFMDAAHAAIDAAIADLEPVRIGHGTALTTEVHNDRRCSNPDEDDPEMPFTRVDRVSDGQTKAVLVYHAVHPTVVSARRLALSQDLSGAIEARLAERFDHPVFTMFVNGAAADMSPASPGPPDPGASPWDNQYARLEGVADIAADAVLADFEEVEMADSGVVWGRTARFPINRQLLGYTDEDWPHEHGAVYCGLGSDGACIGEEPPNERLLRTCVPFPDEASAAPKQAPVTVAQVGDRLMVTTPGEFSVALGRRVRVATREATGIEDVVIVGYAQEYTGYSLPEEDWILGGYESSGALWGRRQGDYITDRVIEIAGRLGEPGRGFTFDEQPALPLQGPYDPEPAPPQRSAGPAASMGEVPNALDPGALAQWAWAGGDPGLGNPIVTLERLGDDDTWSPVTRPGGSAVDSDGYEMTLRLEPDPPWEDEEATARTLRWTVSLPTIRPHGGGPALSGETFRFVATGRIAVEGEGEPTDYRLESNAFQVP